MRKSRSARLLPRPSPATATHRDLSGNLPDPANQPPPRIRPPRADWAIIAYGMVSIWLTTVKGCGETPAMKKIGFAERSRFSSNAVWIWRALIDDIAGCGGW